MERPAVNRIRLASVPDIVLHAVIVIRLVAISVALMDNSVSLVCAVNFFI